jgi:hypothetical protein
MRGVLWTSSGTPVRLATLKSLKEIGDSRTALKREWLLERGKMREIVCTPLPNYIYGTTLRKIELPKPSSTTAVEIYRRLTKYNENARKALTKMNEKERELLDGEELEAGCASKVRAEMFRAFEEDLARLSQFEEQLKGSQGDHETH